MTWLLASGLIAATVACVTLAIMGRADAKALVHAGDLLNGQRKLTAEYESKWKTSEAALSVARTQLEQEQNLRAIAEVQRNSAQERVRELLRKHVMKATNEEIQELTNEAFATPLSIAPRAPAAGAGRVPQVPRSEDARDGLLNPFAPDVQPPKPA